MSAVEIHGMALSAPCRICYLACEASGIEYKMVNCDLMNGENKTPEYLKMNPQHTIPCMKDGDFCLNESRPIATYLITKYGKDDKLYPKDVVTRAIVDQRLYFDMGNFYKSFGDCVYPIMFGGPTPGPEKLEKFVEVMGWVNDFIKPTGYVAGTDHLTVADLCFVATYATIEACGKFDLTPYAETNAWFEKMKTEIPNYEKANGEGAAAFGGWFKSKNV